jgi:FMN reductase [NAD(P)H]
MEFQEVLRQRRMIRRYRSEPIPEDAMERIVSTVLRGPTGGFSLIVITKPEARQGVVEALRTSPSRIVPNWPHQFS